MKRLFQTIEDNRKDVFDVVRAYLGFVLIWKGVYFLGDMGKLQELIGMSDSFVLPVVISHYIIFAHIVGGFFLIIGFLTRTVVLFQIPILMGAVFLVHFRQGDFGNNASLEFAVFVLIMLVAYAFWGSGRLSADYYLETRSEEPKHPSRAHA